MARVSTTTATSTLMAIMVRSQALKSPATDADTQNKAAELTMARSADVHTSYGKTVRVAKRTTTW